MMLLPHGTIVAVIDGKNLELYRNSGNEAAPELSPMNAPKLDAHNKDGGSRHYSSSANPGHLIEEDAHAAAAIAWLNQRVASGEITHLFIVAPPRTLGEVRRRYDKGLKAALIGELHKELIGRGGLDILHALQSQ